MITNFHLPKGSPFIMTSSFTGVKELKNAVDYIYAKEFKEASEYIKRCMNFQRWKGYETDLSFWEVRIAFFSLDFPKLKELIGHHE